MRATQRAVLWRFLLLGACAGSVGLLALASGGGMEGRVLGALILGLVGIAFLTLRRRDRWRGWEPPAGVTIDRRPKEIPVLSDHREVLGSTATNLIEGPGWQAFEMLGRTGVDSWVVALPLNRDCGRWKVEALDPRVADRLARTLPFSERYLGVFAPEGVKRILSASDVSLDLQCDGDVLIARYPGMGPLNFDTWYAEDLPLLERIRHELAPETPPTREQRAVGASPAINAGRNVWRPGEAAPAAGAEPFPLLRRGEHGRR